uniref:Protein FAM136A n=1 Tax=Strigamia maritima TaxID=126957 RepID=T1IIX2_STRMM
MAEATVARVQLAVDKFLTDIDKFSLRKLQANMHACALKCCQNEDASLEQVQRCVQDCSGPLSSAQSYVQTEMNSFQDRLQRGVLECQDKIRDKIGPNTSEDDVMVYRGEFEKCVDKCADTHINLLPLMFKRMKETLSSQNNKK